MERIVPGRAWPLYDAAGTRQLEQAAAAALPPHTLMQRAGLAVARLARALAPHARSVWVACGPGNNGGDGLEAAALLAAQGLRVSVTWLGNDARLPADARASLTRARAAKVQFVELDALETGESVARAPAPFDLVIDALFGLGQARPLEGAAARAVAHLNAARAAGAVLLAVDLPSGLSGDTGAATGPHVRASHTLSLLTLKPGLFTAQGRDAAGEVWWDDLGVATGHEAAYGTTMGLVGGAAAAVVETPIAASAQNAPNVTLTVKPRAWLTAAPAPRSRAHASHKGSHGDVAVVGGAPGMTGAALLAASAALHAGAGRVFAALLDGGAMTVDPSQPELMFRQPEHLNFAALHLACGCGGGQAVREMLPRALSTARSLVLDADALNAVAADPQLLALLRARSARNALSGGSDRSAIGASNFGGAISAGSAINARGRPTVLTPHPLEAARLLGTTAAQVQADRLGAAQQLVKATGAVVVLKGSGTIIAAPGHTPRINPTGNARLATGGTGDVLAGWIAALLAQGEDAFEAASGAVYAHGAVADAWPADGPTLSASSLARAAG